MKHALFCLASLAAVTLALPGVAMAQDKPVEMKFGNWVPAQHALAKTGFEPWAKSVEAASGGSIKVALFPAQQLGKANDHYDMARDGIAEITYVNPGYQAGRFPIFADPGRTRSCRCHCRRQSARPGRECRAARHG